MPFESLANELLLDLFEHLDIGYLFRAFYGLNARFNQLLYIHFRTRQLSFQHLWKDDFDVMCQQYLPSIVEQVISISLSNKEIHGLTELFLSHSFTMNRFTHLESLSLYHVHFFNTLIKITLQCRSLMHLTQLNIIRCEVDQKHDHAVADLFNNIWSIPNLIHCNLNTIWKLGSVKRQFTAISSSIEHLSIEEPLFDMGFLLTLLECTPRLQRLCMRVSFYGAYRAGRFAIPSITSLKIFFDGSLDCLKELFRSMPNLNHLTLITSSIFLDGHAWEQIILEYLPRIKIFRLTMNFMYPNSDYRPKQVSKLLVTFQSPFWIDKHRWFIRCQWNATKLYNRYTSIYGYDRFGYSNKCCSKSTCLDEAECWSSGRLEIANDWNQKYVPFDICNNSFARFPSICRLEINQSIDANFLSCSPRLNQLTSLNVFLNKDHSYSHLQKVLDQAPHLYSLGLHNYERAYIGLFQLQSTSICRLEITGDSNHTQDFFDIKDSSSFVISPLGSKCEVLLIHVKTRTVILDLIHNMFNLRSLHIRCKDDNFSSRHDELVAWLRKHLPSSYSVTRHFETEYTIQLWIGAPIEDKISSNDSSSMPKGRSRTSRFLTKVNRFFPTKFRQSN